MERLTHTHLIRLILTSILFLGACTGVWYVSTSMRAKEDRVLEVKQHLASYEQNKKTFIEENARFKTIKERVEHVESYRISIATVPNLLSAIETIAKDHGVTFTITTVDAPKKATDSQELAIDFLASGTASAIEAFVADMQKQPYEISFSKFSLYRDTPQQNPSTPTTGAPSGGWQLLGRMNIISF